MLKAAAGLQEGVEKRVIARVEASEDRRDRIPSVAAAAGLVLLLHICAVIPAHAHFQVSGAQQTPARDQSVSKERRGTAMIRGRVVAADTGRPLRRALVTVTASELGSTRERTTSTGLDGRYEFKELPAARYEVSVSRGGYLPLNYGQRRPEELGRPVHLAHGQNLDKVDFALPRMSAISGRVMDETGAPIEGVSVYVLRSMFYEGRRKLVPVGAFNVITDDNGEYRMRRLPPGRYVVMASTNETWTVVQNGQETVFGYMPTYFAGVTKPDEARRVTLGLGQEAAATDFTLVPGRSATISGQALDSKGRPFSQVRLAQEIRGLNFATFSAGNPVTVAPDGTFTAKNVPPGEYTLSASRLADSLEGEAEVALMSLSVEGSDIENLLLVGSAGGTVGGRVLVEGARLPKFSAISVSVVESLRNLTSPVILGAFRTSGGASVEEDGTFSVPHVFGRARFNVSLPDGWMLKAIVHDGRDITDLAVELASRQELKDVEVIITDRMTSVAGQIKDGKNVPIQEATVLLFPTDANKWYENAQSIRTARPDQQGEWQVKGLRAGEYFAVALDYVEKGNWHDPEFLDSLRRYATRVQVAEGASATVSLKLTIPR